MKIPVFVQPPNRPQDTRYIGHADDGLTAKEVAAEVGVPDDSFLEGKILKRGTKKGGPNMGERKNLKPGARHWSLVANVKFRERAA